MECFLTLLGDNIDEIPRCLLIANTTISLASDKGHIGDFIYLPGFEAANLQERLREDVMPLNEMKPTLMR